MWSVDLGRVDILLEMVIMSTYLALPHSGHLEHILHIFGYLEVNRKKKFCLDPQHPAIDERFFAVHYWYNFYQDAKDTISVDATTTRENVVSTHFFVDADHSGDRSTRRSQTGLLIFVNK